MKIITWNCNMAFRKKADLILAHKPDILVVPECESPDKLIFENNMAKPTKILWFGENTHKGLAIFSYGDFRLQVIKDHNSAFRFVVPISVTSANFRFTLFAVWAHNPYDPDGRYITQVWKAIHHYDKILKKKKTILTGDFNSNTIWDRPKREGNHSAVVKKLEEKNIFSTYHKHFSQSQGKEQHPTLYMYRHEDKPYHIDYCFASIDMIDRLKTVEIGEYSFWHKYSDHVPVIVTFDISLGD